MPGAQLEVRSTAFSAGATIPTQFTGDGEDVSPELSWTGVPPAAKELALIMDDPDAPSPQPWVHWVMYKIPAATAELPQAEPKADKVDSPAGAVQGKNSWGGVGYRGPAPPKGHGTHHYHFKLYALDAPLDVPPGADKAALEKAMSGHVLAQGEVVGTYRR
jgi:Raf kinase inhibitor-like YbhB/YbcL family protein